MTEPLALVAIGATAMAVGRLATVVFPPTRRLAGRVRPYTVAARASLGRAADPRAAFRAALGRDDRAVTELFRAVLVAVATRIGRSFGGASEAALLSRLDQAGLFTDLPEEQRVAEFRVRQLAAAAGWAATGLLAGLILGKGALGATALVLVGAVAGVARTRARLDRALEDRRDRMRIELYTVNQLLAMNIRVGGGVLQAARRVVERGQGAVVSELAEILRAHSSGTSAREAFLHAAESTADAAVARTYRLLAAGSEYGADLAGSLLEHSEDLREARRESLRRAATRRRAATLLPIIGVLAPVMLLFVAAPLPSIVFSLP